MKKALKKNVNHIDNERKDILNYLENMNSKYNKNYKQISQLYYNVMNKNIILKKNEFLKKYKNFYSPTDLTIIYYYLKKFQLLTNKKKHLSNKIQILNSRKNVFDKVNYSFSLRKLEDMFYTHGKKDKCLIIPSTQIRGNIYTVTHTKKYEYIYIYYCIYFYV